MASKPAKRPDPAPLPYSLKHADLKFQVTAECVSGTIQLEGEIFSKSAFKVPLVSGLTILDAQQKGKELPLEQEGGTHMAVLPGAAEFSIALTTGMAVAIEPGRASFNLPVPAAGTAERVEKREAVRERRPLMPAPTIGRNGEERVSR